MADIVTTNRRIKDLVQERELHALDGDKEEITGLQKFN